MVYELPGIVFHGGAGAFIQYLFCKWVDLVFRGKSGECRQVAVVSKV